MSDKAHEASFPPFTAFNFEIQINVDGVTDKDSICHAAFSECDGLEMTMEPKTLLEGGNNTRQFHLIGPVTYSTLTLKRGMTNNFDLWDWFDAVIQSTKGRRLRADADVVVKAADRKTIQLKFRLTGCLPIKLKAPALNANDTGIAIEEMQINYETMTRI